MQERMKILKLKLASSLHFHVVRRTSSQSLQVRRTSPLCAALVSPSPDINQVVCRVFVAFDSTPGSVITLPATANEFAIKGETLTDVWLRMKEMLRNCHGHNLSKGGIIKIFYHDLNETTQEVLNAAAGGPSKTDTERNMARMDAMTMKMDAQYKELQSQSKQSTLEENDDDLPMSREEEAKFMQTFRKTRFYNDYRDPQQSTNAFVKETFMDLKSQLKTVAKNHQASIQNLETKFGRLAEKQSGRPSGLLPSNTQPNPRGNNSKAYQPPQSRNEHKFTISKDEDEEPTPQPKPQPTKETPTPKPYKPKIPYPQRLRKEKMEAQYGKFLDIICAVHINVPLVDILAGMPNYGKFLKDLISNKNKIEQISAAFLSDESSAMIQNKVPPKLGDPRSFLIPCNFNKAFSCNVVADIGASINLMPYSIYAKLSLGTLKPTKMSVRLVDRSFQYPVRIAENMLIEVGKFTFPVDFVILEMEEDRKIPTKFLATFLHTADVVIRVKQKQLTLGVGIERIIFNINSALKHSYSNDDTCFSIDVIDEILEEDFDALLDEGNIPGICPSFCKHKIQLLDDKKPVVHKQRRLNPNMQEVVKKEIVKLIDTVVTNKNDELVPTRTVTGWRVCINYRKLNEATAKDHFPLPFMDQMLERLVGNKYFCFLDGFSGYFQIPIDPIDQEKTTFTCPFRTHAYRRMPFGFCNAPATFQRCMLAIFHDMIEESIKVFMDDFSVFGNSFDKCLNNLNNMLQRCKDAHLVLNWEKCHFILKEGIVIGYKVSSAGHEVDKAKKST
ncbi:reverse transcriptase domain-containing protein [Tanacetum coccineum]